MISHLVHAVRQVLFDGSADRPDNVIALSSKRSLGPNGGSIVPRAHTSDIVARKQSYPCLARYDRRPTFNKDHVRTLTREQPLRPESNLLLVIFGNTNVRLVVKTILGADPTRALQSISALVVVHAMSFVRLAYLSTPETPTVVVVTIRKIVSSIVSFLVFKVAIGAGKIGATRVRVDFTLQRALLSGKSPSRSDEISSVCSVSTRFVCPVILADDIWISITSRVASPSRSYVAEITCVTECKPTDDAAEKFVR